MQFLLHENGNLDIGEFEKRHSFLFHTNETQHGFQMRFCYFCTIVQSICTHYSCFENLGRLVTLKKIRSKIWVTNNWVIVIQKEKRPGLPLLFLNESDFCTLLFATHILDTFFKVPAPKKISGRPEILEQWVQIDLA